MYNGFDADLVEAEELELQENPKESLTNEEISTIVVGLKELFANMPSATKVETGKFIIDDRFKLFAEFMGLTVEKYNPVTYISVISKKVDD